MGDNTPLRVKLAAALIALYCISVFAAVQIYNARTKADMSYVTISGGGFIYNYRIADIRSGITVTIQRNIPIDATLSAAFNIPKGNTIEISQDVRRTATTYLFETDRLEGIEADEDYLVVLRLLNRATGDEIERHTKILKTGVAPRHMPSQPLTLGPGYHPTPALSPAVE